MMTHFYVATVLMRQQKEAVERQAREYGRRHPAPAVEPTDVTPREANVSRWRRGLRVVFTHG